jgi:EmrB/QacA subfamily drug resistance transporter
MVPGMSESSPAPYHVGKHPWLAVALVAFVQLMVVLDASITNVALPSIGISLHMDTQALSWVVNAYILVFGGLMMLGGRMGDLLGRRKLFMVGLIVFGVGSLLGGLSNEEWQIIAARSIQGLGGAVLMPSVLSIVASVFAEGAERNKAMGVLGAVAGSGGAVGVLLGGILTDKVGWEWVFFVNVPIAVLAFVLTPFLLDESVDESLDRSYDVLGAILVTLGITSLVYAMVDANDAGWSSGQTLGLLGGSAVLLAAFVWVELRAKQPLVRLSIFRNRSVTGANVVSLVTGAALFSMFYFITFYMQKVLGYTPLQSGVRYLPLAVSIILAAGFASFLTTKLGYRIPILAGLLVTSAGLGWFTQIDVHGSFHADVLGPSLLAGAGLGLVFVPLTIAAVTGVVKQESGMASGILNTTQQVGGAIGLAALVAIFSSQSEDAAKDGVGQLAAMTEGFQAAFAGAVVFALAGLVLGIFMLRSGVENAEPGA